MNDDFKQKVMRLAYSYFERAYEKQEYIYEDGYIYVAVVGNALVIEDNGIFNVHVVFCRSSGEARRIAEVFIELYKCVGYMSIRINRYIQAVADKLVTYYAHPRVFHVYQSRTLPDGE